MKKYLTVPTIFGRSLFFEFDTKAPVHKLLDWEVEKNDVTIWLNKLTITYSLEGKYRRGQTQLPDRNELDP
jgi:hypothetical protein